MNLHQLNRQAIGVISQDILAELKQSDGFNILADGTQQPKYKIYNGMIHIQPVPSNLQLGDFILTAEIGRVVYLRGSMASVVRADQKGGDVLRFPARPCEAYRDWKVVAVLEQWPTWCKVAVVMQ